MAPVPPPPLFRVHITGFGPFRQIRENPSTIATAPLNGTILTSPPPPLNSLAISPPHADAQSPNYSSISITTESIPTAYIDVNERVHKLHGLSDAEDNDQAVAHEPYDLILHVGLGRSGTLCLEQRGRRYGYAKTDVDGKYAPIAGPEGYQRQGYVSEEWDGLASVGPQGEEMRPKVNGVKVRDWVRSMGAEKIILSEDAGLYLCEFIFFGSLAAAKRPSAGGKETFVQFLHIPGPGFKQETTPTYTSEGSVHVLDP
ncbi:pyroglutamyl-peptidase, partial [Phenoliferia sp. Uapishka_3]